MYADLPNAQRHANNRPGARAPRPLWVLVPRWSESAMKIAMQLAPLSRQLVAHGPGHLVSPGPIRLALPAERGTLPALAASLLWLEAATDEATVVVLGPNVPHTHAMVGAIRRAVGMTRLDANRVTAIGPSAAVARDEVLRTSLSRWAPQWWWPLWDSQDDAAHRSEVYGRGECAEIEWVRWMRPGDGPAPTRCSGTGISSLPMSAFAPCV